MLSDMDLHVFNLWLCLPHPFCRQLPSRLPPLAPPPSQVESQMRSCLVILKINTLGWLEFSAPCMKEHICGEPASRGAP